MNPLMTTVKTPTIALRLTTMISQQGLPHQLDPNLMTMSKCNHQTMKQNDRDGMHRAMLEYVVDRSSFYANTQNRRYTRTASRHEEKAG